VYPHIEFKGKLPTKYGFLWDNEERVEQLLCVLRERFVGVAASLPDIGSIDVGDRCVIIVCMIFSFS
jgi:hypothetical protein